MKLKFGILVVIAVSVVMMSRGMLSVARAADDTGGDSAGYEIGKQLGAAAGTQGANLGTPVDPRVTVILIIRVLLSFTTIVLVAFTLYAGFMWMTAGGNEEQVTTAKTTIRNCVIGLVIVLSAYSITIFAANLARGYSSGFGGGRTPVQATFGSFFQSGK